MISPFILKIACLVAIPFVLYLLVVIAVLLFGKIKKDENGRRVFRVDSWHFKMAYPRLRKKEEFLKQSDDQGIDPFWYYLKLSFMVYLGWPLLGLAGMIALIFFSAFYVLDMATVVIGSVILFTLGKYFHKSNWYWPRDFFKHNNLNGTHSWWPISTIEFFKMRQFVFRPIYVILPALYVYALYYYNFATPVSIWGHSLGIVTLISIGTVATILIVSFILLILILFALKRPNPKNRAKQSQ